jgi:FkbM family methyltransferase
MHEAERQTIKSDGAASLPPGKRSLLKRIARKAARLVYRAALPVLRPLAFRTRRYLAQGIQDELSRTQGGLTNEIRNALAVEMQTLQHTIQSVQHEVLSDALRWHDIGYRQLEELIAGLHQATQHAREVLREELIRTVGSGNQELQAVNQELQAVIVGTQVALDTSLNANARLERIEQYSYASARRVAVHCDHGTVLIKTTVGYVLCDDSDHAVLANLIDAGELEPGTRRLIERFLKPGDVFVDVGANLGMISLAAARAMQGKGKIFTFEPFAPTKALLEKTFWLNGFSSILESHGAAVSNRRGHTRLFLGTTSGHHSIFPLDTTATDTAQYVDVPLVTLDDALPAQQQVTLLKIDAEGAELDVINGALATQANNPDMGLIVEFGSSHLRRVGRLPSQWLSVFNERGFKCRAIHPESGVLEDWSPERLMAVDSINLFFAQDGSRVWTRFEDAE